MMNTTHDSHVSNQLLRFPCLPSCWLLFGLISVCILAAGSSNQALAQKKKTELAQKAVAKAGDPILSTPVYLYGTTGEAVEHTLNGTDLGEVHTVSVLGTDLIKTTIISKKANQLYVKFETAKECPLGLYQLRVVSENGVSPLKPFCVDCLKEVFDDGKNNKFNVAQQIEINNVVSGNIEAEKNDFYKFTVKANQVVTFDCFAKRIGSQLDPVIMLYDVQTGREYTSLYADDTPGLQSDARLSHQFKQAGTYAIAVRDTTYRGGNDFDYRLRVSDGGVAMHLFPPIVQVGQKSDVEFFGKYMPAKSKDVLNTKSIYISKSQPIHFAEKQFPLNLVALNSPQIIEVEPNNNFKTAKEIILPVGISARFAEKNDVDLVSFVGKKGQKIEADCKTAELGSPCEVHLKLLDEKEKELAVSDPQKTAASIRFTLPADGRYFISAEHLNYLSGGEQIYHLTIQEAKPAINVTLGLDRLLVPLNGYALMPIIGIDRVNFSAGETVTIKLNDDELFEGETQIDKALSPSREKPCYLPIRLKNTKQADAKKLTVLNVNVSAGKQISGIAKLSDITRGQMAGLRFLPSGWDEQIVLANGTEVKWGGEVEGPGEIVAGKNIKWKIKLNRGEMKEAVECLLLGLPTNVGTQSVTIAGDKNEADVEINADSKAVEVGSVNVYLKLTANAKSQTTYAKAKSLSIRPAEKKPEEKKPEEKKPEEKKPAEKKPEEKK